ncbi:MAG TPA: hypothetical protein VNI02_02680, partial [Blastocatellia bacterium]|nr:hypothetical protein [Blastocatellia bacterium]
PLAVGLAQCAHCGAQVGTLFDEKAIPRAPVNEKRVKKAVHQMDDKQRIEQAQDRANNSSVLALSSFFPLLGLAMGLAAVFLGLKSARTLKAYNVEDGRGSAMAGYMIGAIGIIAQVCLIIYVIKIIGIVR